MFIVINPINSWYDYVGTFDTFDRARRFIGINDTFRIIKPKRNSQDWDYVYIRDVSKKALDSMNSIKSRRYVKSTKAEYAEAVKKLLKMTSMSVEELARAINKPVQFVQHYAD